MNAVLDDLPAGSELEVIEGASHVAFIEKPYYRDFKDRLIRFLGSTQAAGEENNVIYAIRKNGVLRVGTAGDYLPMSYLDPETNTYS